MTRFLDQRTPWALALRETTDRCGPQYGEASKTRRSFYVRLDGKGGGEILDMLPEGMVPRPASNGVRMGRDLAGRVTVCIPPTFAALRLGPDRMDAVDGEAMRSCMLALAELLATSAGPSDR
jgi:hypothetical protein